MQWYTQSEGLKERNFKSTQKLFYKVGQPRQQRFSPAEGQTRGHFIVSYIVSASKKALLLSLENLFLRSLFFTTEPTLMPMNTKNQKSD